MDQSPGLDDPDYARFAWGRFKRILAGMALVAALVAGGSVLLLWHWLGELYLHVAIATFLGVFLTIMMTAALMGLMFLSSGTGHDSQVEDRVKGEVDLD